jgi:hypothetical protein
MGSDSFVRLPHRRTGTALIARRKHSSPQNANFAPGRRHSVMRLPHQAQLRLARFRHPRLQKGPRLPVLAGQLRYRSWSLRGRSNCVPQAAQKIVTWFCAAKHGRHRSPFLPGLVLPQDRQRLASGRWRTIPSADMACFKVGRLVPISLARRETLPQGKTAVLPKRLRRATLTSSIRFMTDGKVDAMSGPWQPIAPVESRWPPEHRSASVLLDKPRLGRLPCIRGDAVGRPQAGVFSLTLWR